GYDVGDWLSRQVLAPPLHAKRHGRSELELQGPQHPDDPRAIGEGASRHLQLGRFAQCGEGESQPCSHRSVRREILWKTPEPVLCWQRLGELLLSGNGSERGE